MVPPQPGGMQYQQVPVMQQQGVPGQYQPGVPGQYQMVPMQYPQQQGAPQGVPMMQYTNMQPQQQQGGVPMQYYQPIPVQQQGMPVQQAVVVMAQYVPVTQSQQPQQPAGQTMTR